MRSIILFLLAALTGCAHISHQDPQTGLEVTYTGSAHGAVALVQATDGRPYDMASEAMDKGMSTSLSRDADGDVRFNAGYGYTPGGSVGGYAAPNTGFVPGQGFVTGPPTSSLPPADRPVPRRTRAPHGRRAGGLHGGRGGRALPPPHQVVVGRGNRLSFDQSSSFTATLVASYTTGLKSL